MHVDENERLLSAKPERRVVLGWGDRIPAKAETTARGPGSGTQTSEFL